MDCMTVLRELLQELLPTKLVEVPTLGWVWSVTPDMLEARGEEAARVYRHMGVPAYFERSGVYREAEGVRDDGAELGPGAWSRLEHWPPENWAHHHARLVAPHPSSCVLQSPSDCRT